MCTDNCPRILSVPRFEQFFESQAGGKISVSRDRQFPRKNIRTYFCANRGYCVCYPSNILPNA